MDLSSSFAIGLVTHFFYQWLKKFSSFNAFVDAIPGANKYIHKTITALITLIAALGIHLTVIGSWNDGWSFNGSVPNGPELLIALWHWLISYLTQNFAYQATRDPNAKV